MTEPDPLQEASDPSTDPERLRELAEEWDDPNEPVQRAARKNPSLPEDVWREVLLDGQLEAWANPMAPFYLLAWTPHKDDPRTLENGARLAMQALWETPERCSSEGKILLAAKIQAWWTTSESSRDMMRFLGAWVTAKGQQSPEHLNVLRILVLCVRTTPDLTDKERQALDFLEAWSTGGEDRRKEAYVLASLESVKDTFKFAKNYQYSPWNAMYEVLEEIGPFKNQAKNEHSRRLADVIRREMPLPPVVD